MISLLISLLVFCLIAAVVWYIIGMLPLPPIAKQIAMVIIALIFLIWLLNALGALGDGVGYGVGGHALL